MTSSFIDPDRNGRQASKVRHGDFRDRSEEGGIFSVNVAG